MKPLRTADVTGATPVDLRGRRTRQFELPISERNKLLVEASAFFPGCSDREVARRLRTALSNYRGGRWQRDRSEATCPLQHQGKLVRVLWMILRTVEHVPSERTIRLVLGRA